MRLSVGQPYGLPVPKVWKHSYAQAFTQQPRAQSLLGRWNLLNPGSLMGLKPCSEGMGASIFLCSSEFDICGLRRACSGALQVWKVHQGCTTRRLQGPSNANYKNIFVAMYHYLPALPSGFLTLSYARSPPELKIEPDSSSFTGSYYRISHLLVVEGSSFHI